MSRFIVAFWFLPLFLCSVGCRICTTPHDCRISTYIDRCDDYRGNNPLYRAGTIFGGWNGTHQMFSHANYEGEYADFYTNAGNYGVTTPIMLVNHSSDTGTGAFSTHHGTEQSTGPIAIPEYPPGGNEFILPPYKDSIGTIPEIDELINRNRGTVPLPSPLAPPLTPPVMPKAAPLDGMPSDSIPFSPSDAMPNGVFPGDEAITPPNTFPKTMETDPPITLEELRRLDPSIQDVQIISIEDATPSTLVR